MHNDLCCSHITHQLRKNLENKNNNYKKEYNKVCCHLKATQSCKIAMKQQEKLWLIFDKQK